MYQTTYVAELTRKNGVQNFGTSKAHLTVGFMQKNRLKCIGMTIITPYFC